MTNPRVIAERKNGVTSLTESCEQLMSNFTAACLDLRVRDYDSITKDLKVRLRVDSSK